MPVNVKTSLTSGILASTAATLCCVMPFFLLMLGISGAWISYLVALEPYQPIFVTVALVALVFAYKIFALKMINSVQSQVLIEFIKLHFMSLRLW